MPFVQLLLFYERYVHFTHINKGGKQKYEKHLAEERNKKFYENLKHTAGFYSAQKWEDDYKHQVNQ